MLVYYRENIFSHDSERKHRYEERDYDVLSHYFDASFFRVNILRVLAYIADNSLRDSASSNMQIHYRHHYNAIFFLSVMLPSKDYQN
jgi:hypothetical protein